MLLCDAKVSLEKLLAHWPVLGSCPWVSSAYSRRIRLPTRPCVCVPRRTSSIRVTVSPQSFILGVRDPDVSWKDASRMPRYWDNSLHEECWKNLNYHQICPPEGIVKGDSTDHAARESNKLISCPSVVASATAFFFSAISMLPRAWDRVFKSFPKDEATSSTSLTPHILPWLACSIWHPRPMRSIRGPREPRGLYRGAKEHAGWVVAVYRTFFSSVGSRPRYYPHSMDCNWHWNWNCAQDSREGHDCVVENRAALRPVVAYSHLQIN